MFNGISGIQRAKEKFGVWLINYRGVIPREIRLLNDPLNNIAKLFS